MFGSITNCLNEKDLIAGCLNLLDVEEKVVIISSKNYNGEDVENDDSEQIARDCGATIIKTELSNQAEMRNLGLEYLQNKGIKYGFIVDADEWYSKDDLDKIKDFIKRKEANAYKIKLTHMFKEKNWSVPSEGDRGTVICLKTSERFKPELRRDYTHGHTELIPDVTAYHFSYAKDPEVIKKKLKNFSHRDEVIPNWFENVFMEATLESRNVHPTVPNAWPEIKEITLPNDIWSQL